MNVRFGIKKVQFFVRRLATILAILFLCAPIGLLRADSTTEPTTEIHKKISPVAGKEDQHELSLDITSTLGAETQTDPLDVVLVADLSGSMEEQDVWSSSSWRNISRIEALKNTLRGTSGKKGLIDTILSNKKNRLSIVGFAGKIDNLYEYRDYYTGRYDRWPDSFAGYYSGAAKNDDSTTILGWSNDRNVALSSVNNMKIPKDHTQGIGTGTNIGAGLGDANTLLRNARTSAKKVVILLSDGFANMYYDDKGYTIYNWNNIDGKTETAPEWFDNYLKQFLSGISSDLAPKLDGFYSIKFRYSNNRDSISDIKSYIGQYNSSIPNEIFSANDENDLQQKFKEITDKILPLGIHHVTISDVLSKYVKLLPNGSSNLRVVKMKEGYEEKLTSNQVTIDSKTTEKGLVEVTAKFNPDYTLEDGAKYVLKFTVTSTQEAFDAIAGDKKPTSEDAEGGDATKLYSNKGAKVTYSYGIGTSHTKTVEYKEKPTFTPSAPLTVPVKVEWRGVNNVVNDHVTAPKPKQIDVKLVQKGKDGGQDKPNYRETTIPVTTGQSSFASVAKGYDYEVTAPEATGFSKSIEKDGAGFKVIYRQLPTLAITKELKAETNPNKVFKILITNAHAPNGRGGSDWLNGHYGGLNFVGGKTEITIKAGQTIYLPYMPRGTHYKIEEKKESSKGYQVTYENQEGRLLAADVTAKVINHKLPSLSIKKEVSGVFANLLQEFDIQISVQNEGKPLTGIYRAFRGGDVINVVFSGGKATVTLKRGQSVNIENLPIGATYSVEEAPASARGYQVTYEGQTGTLTESKKVVVRNTKNSIPETGIDFLSSELMLGIALPLGVIFFTILLGHLVVNRRN